MNKIYSYSFPAKLEELPNALNPVLQALEEVEVDHRTAYQVRLALDEILSNIVEYAYNGGEGEVKIRYELTDAPSRIIINIIDEGVEFNPLEVEDPNLSKELDERDIGGLGLFIVKNIMDEMTYRRDGNRNVLIIKKNI